MKRAFLAALALALVASLAGCSSAPAAKADPSFASLFTLPKNSDPDTILTVLKGKYDRAADKDAVSRGIIDGFVYCDTCGLKGGVLAVGVAYVDGKAQLFWVARGDFRDFIDKRIGSDEFVSRIKVEDFTL